MSIFPYKVQVKVLDSRAKLPERGTALAAGYDLFACIDAPVSIRAGEKATLIPTGLAMFSNEASMAGIILPRSGLGHKQGLVLGNTLGLIDGDYQNQWFVSAWNRGQQDEIVINPGDRIAQVMFVPVIHPDFLVVDEFTVETERGLGGFGSTGLSSEREVIQITAADMDAIDALVATPPSPSDALRQVARSHIESTGAK